MILSRSNCLNFFLITFLMTIPHILFIYQDYSLSIGIALSCILLFFSSYKYFTFDKKEFFLILTLFTLIFIQSSFIIIDTGNFKPIYSAFLFFSCIILVKSYANKIALNRLNFEQIIKNSLCVIIFFGWFSFIFKDFFSYPDRFVKFIFPFSEHSHYALCVGFLTIIYGYFQSQSIKLILFFNLLVQSIYFPNLTLMQFSMMSFMIFFLMRSIKLFIIFIFLFFIFYFLFFGMFLLNPDNYFLSRINFNNTDNLSALVYLQGLDDAWISLTTTYGVGLGFQMAGSGPEGYFTNMIYRFYNTVLNREDGSFLAAKIVIEFGVVGLLSILMYVFLIFKKVTKIILSKGSVSLFDIALIAFFIEMFFRGIGYFSPQLFLLIILYFYSKIDSKIGVF